MLPLDLTARASMQISVIVTVAWLAPPSSCCPLQAEPSKIKALLRRGCAREALGQLQEAADDLQAAFKLQPADKEASEGVQQLERKLGAGAAAEGAAA
jgi:hypothetical protein